MTPPSTDPNIDHLKEIMAEYRAAEEVSKKIRVKVNAYIQQLKREGYSYPVLARETEFSPGTIQKIVAKDPANN